MVKKLLTAARLLRCRPIPLPKRYARFLLLLCILYILFLLAPFSTTTTTLPAYSEPEQFSHPYSADQIERAKSSGFLLAPLPPTPNDTLPGHPPLFTQYHVFERGLPQHNPHLPSPEGKHAQFLYIVDHCFGSGWGNVMQEMMLNAHLAYMSRRAFVFDNYTWSRTGDYATFNGRLIPARIPLSAIISGPIVGAPFPPLPSSLLSPNSSSSPDNHLSTSAAPPRAVSSAYFYAQCPDPVVVNVGDVKGRLQSNPVTAEDVMRAWLARLQEDDVRQERCVELRGQAVFDIWLLGSPHVLDIWPTLSVSPVTQAFGWSPLVRQAFERVRVRALGKGDRLPSTAVVGRQDDSSEHPLQHPWSLLASLPTLFPRLAATSTSSGPTLQLPDDSAQPQQTLEYRPGTFAAPPYFQFLNTSSPSSYLGAGNEHIVAKIGTGTPTHEGLIALHIRRGDFAQHCMHLAKWSSGFNGFNQFADFVDRFELSQELAQEPVSEEHGPSQEKLRVYLDRCFPEVEQVVAKVMRIVEEHAGYDVDGAGGRTKGRLRKVYVMTNGDAAWVAQLKDAFHEAAALWRAQWADRNPMQSVWRSLMSWFWYDEGMDSDWDWDWESIVTSRDLEGVWVDEERYVKQAVDMGIGIGAEVFVGNGFSSLTSNIAMLRMANGLDPRDTRFW